MSNLSLFFFLFFFFYKKIPCVKNAQNANQATFTLLEACVRKKTLPLFFAGLFFVLLANVCLCFFTFKIFL